MTHPLTQYLAAWHFTMTSGSPVEVGPQPTQQHVQPRQAVQVSEGFGASARDQCTLQMFFKFWYCNMIKQNKANDKTHTNHKSVQSKCELAVENKTLTAWQPGYRRLHCTPGPCRENSQFSILTNSRNRHLWEIPVLFCSCSALLLVVLL